MTNQSFLANLLVSTTSHFRWVSCPRAPSTSCFGLRKLKVTRTTESVPSLDVARGFITRLVSLQSASLLYLIAFLCLSSAAFFCRVFSRSLICFVHVFALSSRSSPPWPLSSFVLPIHEVFCNVCHYVWAYVAVYLYICSHSYKFSEFVRMYQNQSSQ